NRALAEGPDDKSSASLFPPDAFAGDYRTRNLRRSSAARGVSAHFLWRALCATPEADCEIAEPARAGGGLRSAMIRLHKQSSLQRPTKACASVRKVTGFLQMFIWSA